MWPPSMHTGGGETSECVHEAKGLMPKLRAIRIINPEEWILRYVRVTRLMPSNYIQLESQLANVVDVVVNYIPTVDHIGLFKAIKHLEITCLPCSSTFTHMMSLDLIELIGVVDKIKVKYCKCVRAIIDPDGYLKAW
jgi:hypothetical protein